MVAEEHGDEPRRERAASEDFLQGLIRSCPAILVVLDRDDREVFAHEGGPDEGAPSVRFLERLDPSSREVARLACAWARASGRSSAFRGFVPTPGGAGTHYDLRVAPHRGANGAAGAGEVVLVGIDVTPLVDEASARAREQAKLQLALDTAEMGLWEWNVETGEVRYDDRTFAILGVEEPLDLEAHLGCVHPDDRHRVDPDPARFAPGPYPSAEYRFIRPDGQVRWIRSAGYVSFQDGRPDHVMGTVVDVTEARRVHEHSRQAQRLESIGTLTAGVAHNFNNLLSVVIPALHEAESHVGAEGREGLHDALEAARRAAELVKQLTTFAGHAPADAPVRLRLDGPLHDAIRLAGRTFARVALSTAIEPELWIRGRASALEQLFLNLLINARDAVQTVADPRIGIRAERVGKRWARVSVEDNGTGMSDEVAERVFEPFFTTKGSLGTGLGLSTGLGIVEEHGGRISVRSAPGRGTSFEVELPLELPLEGGATGRGSAT